MAAGKQTADVRRGVSSPSSRCLSADFSLSGKKFSTESSQKASAPSEKRRESCSAVLQVAAEL